MIIGAAFSFGAPLAAAVNFVIVAATIYFLVVMPLNKVAERRAKRIEPKPTAPNEEVAPLTQIRDSLQARS